MVSKSIIVAILLNIISNVFAGCANPQISNINSFNTGDATIVTKIAYIAEFYVGCENEETPQLFVELENKIIPLARVGDNTYQISWIEDIKKARSGDFNVRLFDEEGYSNLRKAQRIGEDLSTVKSLSEFVINATGAYKGPWVNSELLAILIAGITSYFALTTRSKLVS
ncbi:translocon-associated protein subunit delta [Condylostylus longicornis]|uniref:translocon-associated protein subunit delta n=1 Tax=Condylostylus longicornis TaxID=2530218 RepID=UPI00244E32AE|nr:translocon-associated protein subunit delta [Condylostylus longicornis]XP_055377938.1 translocon-associated protein subunit delta [Condylostylus longicornis]